MTHEEYRTKTSPSNRLRLAAIHIAQAKLYLVQQSAESLSGAHSRGLRETAERLQIFVELLDRLSKVAV